MQLGNAAMGGTPFVGWATVVMFVAGFLLPFGYAVGRARGRRAGVLWFSAVLFGSIAIVISIFVWAGANGQLSQFLLGFGLNPLLEMGMFVLVWLIITGFPSLRGITDLER